MELLTLSNGVLMPALGIGTFLMTPDQAEEAVCQALQCGYPMVDTANAYRNEKAVGRGIRKSGIPREKIFLVSKLWPTVYTAPDAVDRTLERLGIDYLDLLFIHQPAGDFLAGYRQLEAALRAGKVRSIGISNFKGEKLDRLMAACAVKPHVIQMEAHPYCTQREIKSVLAPYGTVTMAWYPLGHGDKALLQEPVFAALGEKYGKTPAQIILRWHIQMGHAVIPGSTNPAHIRDNAALFDFSLTDQDMSDIAQLDRNIRYYNPTLETEESYASFAPDFDSQP